MKRVAWLLALCLCRCTCLPQDITEQEPFVCATDGDCQDGWHCVALRCVRESTCDATSCPTGCCDAGVCGTCSCPAGTRACAGACIATTACCLDSECTVAGQTCQSNACACPTGQRDCYGACLDAQVTCVAPPIALVFSSPPQTVTAAACSQALVIETRDVNGGFAAVPQLLEVSLVEQGGLALQLFSDSGCTVPATELDIVRGDHFVRFWARGALAGSTQLLASATGLTSAMQDLRVVAGPPVLLAFKTPAQSVKSGACSAPVTLEARDFSGNAAPVATAAPLTLTAMPAAGFPLFSDPGCSVPLSAPAIAAGTSSFTFYFLPSRPPSTVRLDASTGALGTTTQTETVLPGDPTRILFATASQSVVAGVCSGPLTLKVQDAQGTDTSFSAATALGLNGPGMTFFTDPTCTAATPSAPFTAGAGTSTVRFVATGVGMPVVTASGGGLTLAMQTQTVNAGPATRLGFTTAPQGVQSAVCSGPVRLSTLDAFDNPSNTAAQLNIMLSANPATGFTFYGNGACAGGGITATSILAGTNAVTFSYRGTTAGMVTMTADSSLDPDPTQVTVVGVMAPTQLVYLTAAQTRLANQCSGAVTVESRDSSNNRSNVGAAVNIALSANPANGFQFFSDPQCTSAVTSVSLAASTSQVSWYFRGTTTGAVVMVPVSTLSGPGGQNATISPAAPGALVFTTPARTASAGTCSTVMTVQTRDAFGNSSPVSADLALALSGVPAGGLTFYSDSACATAPVTTATVLNGQAGTSWFARGTQVPTYNVTAWHPSTGGVTQALSISAAALNKLVVTTTAQSLSTGQCSSALTFERRDAFDNPITVPSQLAVSLSGGAGVTFHATNACGAAITSTAIPANASSITVYFKGIMPGAPMVTGTAVGAAPASQTQTITAGVPTALVFTSAPQTMVPAGTPSAAVVLEARDAFGNAAPVSGDVPVTLSALPATFVYCSDPGCVGTVGSTQLGAGLSSVTFYFRGNVAQTFGIMASASGFTGASQTHTVVGGSATQLKFTSTAQTRNAGACAALVTVQRQDAFGNPTTLGGQLTVDLAANPATGFTFYQGPSCNMAVTNTTLAAGASSASFTFSGTLAGTVQVTASAGTLTSDSQNETINALAPNHLVYTTVPQTIQSTTACSAAVSVEAQDVNNNPSNVAADTVIVPSLPAGAGATFFSNPGCTAQVNNLTMPGGTRTVTYYLTATSTSGSPYTLNTAGGGLTSVGQSLTVGPGDAAKLGFGNAPLNVPVDGCSAAAVARTLDTFNNPAPVAATTVITPAVLPGNGATFFSNATCDAGMGGAVTLLAGIGAGNLYLLGGPLTAGSMVTVTLSSNPALTPAQQNETIVAGPATQAVFGTSAKSLMAGECSSALTLQVLDAAGNNTSVTGGTPVSFAATPSTGFTFFSDPSCNLPVSSLPMSGGTLSFYVKGITGGAVDVVATPSGVQGATQTQTVFPAVRTGICQLAGGLTSTACAISPVLNPALSRTMMLFQTINSGTAAIDDTSVRCVITDTDTIGCSRGGTTGSVDIRWYTVSRPTGLSVQHFNSISTGSGSNYNHTIAAVSQSQSFVLYSSEAAAGLVSYDETRLYTARLSSPTSVTLRRGGTGGGNSSTHALQVVTWTGATVERGNGSETLFSGTSSFSINVPTNGSQPAFVTNTQMWGSNAVGPQELCLFSLRTLIGSSTSLTFSRAAGSGLSACRAGALEIEYERVSLPAAVNRVDQYTVNVAALAVTQTIPAVDLTRTVAFFSGQGLGGQQWGETTDSNVDRSRDAVARANFVDTTTVQVERGAGANNLSQFTLFVWQLVP